MYEGKSFEIVAAGSVDSNDGCEGYLLTMGEHLGRGYVERAQRKHRTHNLESLHLLAVFVSHSARQIFLLLTNSHEAQRSSESILSTERVRCGNAWICCVETIQQMCEFMLQSLVALN